MVLFGVVKWTQEGLYFVNLQAVTTENGDIDDFILKKPNVLGHYFRLDLDLDKPGPLFKEPLPHIHTRPIREPRFSLPLTSSKTCIVDFLEFLYLNFHYDKWRNWAKSIWLSQNPLQEEGVFDAMGEAYAKGKTDWLRDKYAIKIEELRACLLKEKQDISERMAPVSVFARQLKY